MFSGTDGGQEEGLPAGCRYLLCSSFCSCSFSYLNVDSVIYPARLQAPESTEEPKSDQQLSDVTSLGASAHLGSPGSDGSEVNLQSAADSSIQTIAQAASRTDLSRGGPRRTPAAAVTSKPPPPHLPNRYGPSSEATDLGPSYTRGSVDPKTMKTFDYS